MDTIDFLAGRIRRVVCDQCRSKVDEITLPAAEIHRKAIDDLVYSHPIPKQRQIIEQIIKQMIFKLDEAMRKK